MHQRRPQDSRHKLHPGRAQPSRRGYISTRSIGDDHIDVDYAESVGISVENVAYSPDSVADYTLMLMLMAVRDAKSVDPACGRSRLPAAATYAGRSSAT